MNIALIAHNSKKELMIQFCTAYCNIFKKHTLLATATTGRLISEATGLRIYCFLPGSHGGMEQIMARIACDEVDLLLFFRDPLRAGPDEPSSINILRLCDVHTVYLPFSRGNLKCGFASHKPISHRKMVREPVA